MALHTPGPWRTSPNNPTTIYGKRGEGAVAKALERYMNRDERLANAALMTAAPELLEACEEALAWIEDRMPGIAVDAKDSLRMAIAKAKGET
jgi:hypothetical protein